MTLYHKVNGKFEIVSADEEALLRSKSGALFSNDSGYDVVLPDEKATEMQEEWAANDILASQPKPPGPPTIQELETRLKALEDKVP